jgi:uncharacterized protein (DUF433 family)
MPAAIDDRGRGPEIIGTRITVYDVFHYMEHGWSREDTLTYLPITGEQYDQAVEYITDHRDDVLAEHRRIEERNARGNPPEIRARLEESHRRFQKFKEWLAARGASGAGDSGDGNGMAGPPLFAEFKRWLAVKEATNGAGR